jgi:hypothetical protein
MTGSLLNNELHRMQKEVAVAQFEVFGWKDRNTTKNIRTADLQAKI